MQTPALVAVVAAFALCLTQAAVTDTHRCYVEPGFDYVDNDIGNVTSSTADGCCAKCEITTGCKAYSWTDLNGGTCWLKSGRGTIIVKSGVQSATLQSLGDSGSVGGCLLDEGIDYVGNDIGSVPMLKPLGCCSACLYFPGCRAFTFTTHNGGTCWLKSAKGPTIVNPTARSAQPYLEAPSCGLEFGVDYVGNDIGTASASKPGNCCDVCSKRDGCRAFSWTAQNGGTCWLKNRKDGSIVKAGVTSVQVKANPASHWNWMWTTRATTLVTLAALSRTLVAPSVWPKVAATLSRGRITRVERAGSRALRVTRKSRLASSRLLSRSTTCVQSYPYIYWMLSIG